MLRFEFSVQLSDGMTVKPKCFIIQWGMKKWFALVEKGEIVFCRGIGDITGLANIEGGQLRQHVLTLIIGHNVFVTQCMCGRDFWRRIISGLIP